MTFVRQAERDASPISLGSLPDQITACLKHLDGLRCGATGRCLKIRERGRGPGERVGASKKAERHPLGGAEIALIAVGLHKPPYEQQEFCRFAR
jgi:hypothetical protein